MTTGKINEPVTLTSANAGEWEQLKGPRVNLRVGLDQKSCSFTPSENGNYEFSHGAEIFTVTVGDTAPTPGPKPNPSPAAGTLLYDSNVDIDWAAWDGKKIEIGKPYGVPTKPNTKYIRMNASGSPTI